MPTEWDHGLCGPCCKDIGSHPFCPRMEATISNFIRAVNFWHGNWCGAWASRVKQAGFAEANLMHWMHPVLGNVHLTCNNWKRSSQQIVHVLRESWRKDLFTDFLQKDRRDARQLTATNVSYDEQQTTQARYILAQAGSDQRAVMIGAGNSVAVYQRI